MLAKTAAHLREVVPELRDVALSPAQRSLLGTALVAARAPGLLRNGSFAQTLIHVAVERGAGAVPDELDDAAGTPFAAGSQRRPSDHGMAVRTPRRRTFEQPLEANAPVAQTPSVASDPLAATSACAIVTPVEIDGASLAQPERAVESTYPRGAIVTPREVERANADHRIKPKPRPVERTARREPIAAQPDDRMQPSSDSLPTAFGGLFYLLNAALALGIYGDFTMPRSPGIALSPWDFLALVGRDWFGKEIRRDPIWSMLAALAGRALDEEPGRDFDPVPLTGGATATTEPRARSRSRGAVAARRRRWVRRLAAELRDRIAVALDVASTAVPELLCRHEARVVATAADVDVYLTLSSLPLPIRMAGLDRDCGWIPAAGRRVTFHFV